MGEMKRKSARRNETIVMDLGKRYRRRNSGYLGGGRSSGEEGEAKSNFVIAPG